MIHSKKGFTLIELMIVVAIIGTLAAVLLPHFQKMSAERQIQSKQEMIQTPIEPQKKKYLYE